MVAVERLAWLLLQVLLAGHLLLLLLEVQV